MSGKKGEEAASMKMVFRNFVGGENMLIGRDSGDVAAVAKGSGAMHVAIAEGEYVEDVAKEVRAAVRAMQEKPRPNCMLLQIEADPYFGTPDVRKIIRAASESMPKTAKIIWGLMRSQGLSERQGCACFSEQGRYSEGKRQEKRGGEDEGRQR